MKIGNDDNEKKMRFSFLLMFSNDSPDDISEVSAQWVIALDFASLVSLFHESYR
jgi:hypothetical protein